MLAWWRHLRPGGARLAVVVAHAGDELVGLAPFYTSRRLGVTELRLLSGGFVSRPTILVRPGREQQVAASIGHALAGAEPQPDILRWEAVDAASQWPGWLSDGWSGDRGHRLLPESERSAPVLHLRQPNYEEWLGTKSRNFRSQMRRKRRAIEEKGATFRCADRSTLTRDLSEFSRLHSARWEERGGSGAVDSSSLEMLREVGESLIEMGRFRLWMIDGPDEQAVSAQLFLAAGGAVAYWNGGFDESWGDHSPGAVAILAAIEDAFTRNDDLFDLGGGEARYKERLADEDRPVAWRTSYLRGPRYPLARLRGLPEQAARRSSKALRKRLGPERFNRLRRLFDR